MRRRTLSVLILLPLCWGLMVVGAQAGDDTFRPAPLESCDGNGWGGLHFGTVTAQAVKDHYKIDSHNDIPWSLRLSPPGDTGVTINTLFAGKKDTDLLEGFCMRYIPGTLDLATLQGDLGEDGQARYARVRYGDWWVQVFPDKGVAAFVVKTQAGTDIPQVILLPLAALPPAVHSLSATETPICVLVDPHAGEPRVMSFGTTSVTGSVSGLHGSDDFKQHLERRMVDGTAGGAMHYETNASGRYTADISGSYDPSKDRDNHIKVECTIQGTCPYGPIEATADSDARIRSNDDPYRILRDTANDAMKKAESNFSQAMARQGPPTPDQVRASAWERLFVTARTEAIYALTPAPKP
jgi:hypothetical protein